MTTTPNVKTAREIVRKHIQSGRAEIDATIVQYFGPGLLGADEYWAWERAVENERRKAVVTATVSWSDEQQDKSCPCGCPVVEDMCSCPEPCPCEPDCMFCLVPNPMREPDPEHVARGQQAERDDDMRALAETVVRLKRWLAGRQGKVHSVVSSTSVIAEPRDRSTAAWAIAESDVAAVVAALEARIAKAGT